MGVHPDLAGRPLRQDYLSNFATLHIKDELARLDGVGDVQQFGGGNYSMRIWLDPEKVAARGLTARRRRQRDPRAERAGRRGPARLARGAGHANADGRTSRSRSTPRAASVDEEDFRNIIVSSTGSDGQITRLRDVARVELGSDNYALRAMLNNETAVAIPMFQRPG